MRPIRLFSVVVLMLLPAAIRAQGNTLEIIDKPVTAQRLDGTVRMQWDHQPVPDVHVDECDSGWKHVLASTVTDSHGHFHLVPSGSGPIHYIKIYAMGFNIREYKVKLSQNGKPELRLTINVGT